MDACTVNEEVYALPEFLCSDILYTRRGDTALKEVASVADLYAALGDYSFDESDTSWHLQTAMAYLSIFWLGERASMTNWQQSNPLYATLKQLVETPDAHVMRVMPGGQAYLKENGSAIEEHVSADFDAA